MTEGEVPGRRGLSRNRPPALSASGLERVYSEISKGIAGKVAIKVRTGEPKWPHILPRDMVKRLRQLSYMKELNMGSDQYQFELVTL